MEDKMALIMKRIGERGYHVMVRYDPLREEGRFTITCDIDKNKRDAINVNSPPRVGDTDDPISLLIRFLEDLILEELRVVRELE